MENKNWAPWESTKLEALRASKLANMVLAKAPAALAIGPARQELYRQNNEIQERLRAGIYGPLA